ncbi:unnamed protein product [Didymodactylos carnosus]|uniref:Uncharacterized protein n=1 Tax=Didymodactylos carnosus TaxID=1234261 RepID=A0A815SQM8_9BILA|nr:unnamed protein product [Didymodactylos carnosus]CAF1496707.1 unnamed protein product [Didymodactylos carnosus]CAF3524238.1 unnamed protein product [Didymodactylos carnosus]CAF4359112.1 unnamed protein product [Didymodactylos carnosus]
MGYEASDDSYVADYLAYCPPYFSSGLPYPYYPPPFPHPYYGANNTYDQRTRLPSPYRQYTRHRSPYRPLPKKERQPYRSPSPRSPYYRQRSNSSQISRMSLTISFMEQRTAREHTRQPPRNNQNTSTASSNRETSKQRQPPTPRQASSTDTDMKLYVSVLSDSMAGRTTICEQPGGKSLSDFVRSRHGGQILRNIPELLIIAGTNDIAIRTIKEVIDGLRALVALIHQLYPGIQRIIVHEIMYRTKTSQKLSTVNEMIDAINTYNGYLTQLAIEERFETTKTVLNENGLFDDLHPNDRTGMQKLISTIRRMLNPTRTQTCTLAALPVGSSKATDKNNAVMTTNKQTTMATIYTRKSPSPQRSPSINIQPATASTMHSNTTKTTVEEDDDMNDKQDDGQRQNIDRHFYQQLIEQIKNS